MTVLMTVSGARNVLFPPRKDKRVGTDILAAPENERRRGKNGSLSLSRFLRVPFFDIPAPLSELFPARKWPRSFETELRMGRWLYVSKSAAELVAESSRLSLSLSLGGNFQRNPPLR